MTMTVKNVGPCSVFINKICSYLTYLKLGNIKFKFMDSLIVRLAPLKLEAE